MGEALRAARPAEDERGVPPLPAHGRGADRSDAEPSGPRALRGRGRPLAKEQDELGQAGSSIAALLDDFRAALDAYDEPLAQLLLDRMLAAFTLETVLRDALLPYLHELGERWERGEASVAQEHFATSVIRGRLLGLARGWGSGSGPLAVLACPPGEEHDLGLLALGIVLRARGWRVAYLGPDTPMETLADAARRMGADWVVISAVSEARLGAVEEEIARLVRNVPVALGGAGGTSGARGAHGCRAALRRPGRRGGAARGQPPIASKGMAEPRSARLDEVASVEEIARLPYSLRVLLENVVRAGLTGEGDPEEARAILEWQPGDEPHREISFRPARVLLQDFTGVPAIVDLAAMRDAMRNLGGEPARINPLLPSELVIDHSVQVDVFGSKIAIFKNTELEFERNRERYAFLRWGQEAFDDLRVVPPNTGIVHQVNLEYLARVVEERNGWAFPDTLVGTDSHTTMVNSLGVLGWGVGGIEAEAAMLGEPLSMLVPQVVGFRLSGRLPEGSTATDLVLTVTETLRELGVVGKFVEFFGRGLSGLTLADRATIANMSPEYGATCGFFPVDEETLAYLRMTGRSEDHVSRVESYCRAQHLFHDENVEPSYSEVVDLDLGSVEPSLAGPRRPQDRVPLREARDSFLGALQTFGVEYGNHDNAVAETFPASDPTTEQVPGGDGAHAPEPEPALVAVAEVEPASVEVELDGTQLRAGARKRRHRGDHELHEHLEPDRHGRGGPAREERRRARPQAPALGEVEPGARLEGRDRVLRPRRPQPVPRRARLRRRRLRLHDLHRELGAAPAGDLCRGGRGRARRLLGPLRQPQLRGAHPSGGEGQLPRLAAARGRVRPRRADGPRSHERPARPGRGRQRRLPQPMCGRAPEEVQETIASALEQEMFTRTYADVFTGDERWRELDTPEGELFAWEPESTYVRLPPYFEGMSPEPGTVDDFSGARCLVMLGDSVTTDHISPAGAIKPDSPAGLYLTDHGVERKNFNSYGSRRGNHEVMVRGTFANVRLRNLLVPGSEGTWTVHLPDGEETTIFDAAERYRSDGVPLILLAGKEYGSGSSRDWAAKGPKLLGVRAVIAESYERIHRSNLVGMGLLPLQYMPGENAESLGLTGREEFSVTGVENGEADEVTVRADDTEFRARLRADTPRERDYLRHGGVLPYALRALLRG